MPIFCVPLIYLAGAGIFGAIVCCVMICIFKNPKNDKPNTSIQEDDDGYRGGGSSGCF